MLILDKYLIKNWALYFIVTLGFITGIFICQETYNYLYDFLNKDYSLINVISFYFISYVKSFPIICPLSFAVSLIITFAKLHKSGQITAIKLCGLNLYRISLPFIIIGVIASFFIYLLNFYLIPLTEQKRTELIYGLEEKITNKDILVYKNHNENRLWYIEKFNTINYTGGYSKLHILDEKNRELFRLISDSCKYNKNLKTWIFYDGIEITFDPINSDPLKYEKFNTKQFLEFDENPYGILLLNKNPNELSYNEILNVLKITPKGTFRYSNYMTKLYLLFANPLMSLIFMIVIIPSIAIGTNKYVYKNISKIFILIILFFVLRGFFALLGYQNYISPLIAVLAPYIIYLIYSIDLYKKA